jgi:flavin reductase (DIM6/NTAB) family NADH-FMN oxidoreductase RutF
MEFISSELTEDAAYKLLIGSVVPRAIAWITSLSATGQVNAAPFSGFTFVSSKPPMIAVSIGRRQGALKDTAANILREREFVVNIADLALIEALHRSSFEFSADISEVEQLKLRVLPSHEIKTPRLGDAPVNMECRLHDVIEFGDLRTQLFVGEVRRFHVRDGICRDGKIDSVKLNPIARLGGPNYAKLGEIITLGTGGSLTATAPDRAGE